MKFKLTTAGRSYTAEETEKLKKLGFEFEDIKGFDEYNIVNKDVFIEFESLEEILEFSQEWGELIIGQDTSGERLITIYDNYIENDRYC